MLLYFITVGSLSGSCSGGYEYDRRLVYGLQDQGHDVVTIELVPSHPLMKNFLGYSATRSILERKRLLHWIASHRRALASTALPR